MNSFQWWRIFAHRHWITLSVNGKKIRLCTRCSGTVVGYFLLKYVFFQGFKIFNSLIINHQLFLCILFVFPTILDWITQTWDWRESTNNLRLVTGFLLGVSAALFSQIPLPYIFRRILYTSIIIGVLSVGLLGRRIQTAN
ncbi:DUF2085 domain-containing protein [Candidatus Bathyarchaeota archaeon]|nr:DUF2085 domain-containing protein [Candidatus Bathyarchaeota archaeon]